MAHSLRSLGSAAINIAVVASGGLDMYWEIGVSSTRLRNNPEGLADQFSAGLGT